MENCCKTLYIKILLCPFSCPTFVPLLSEWRHFLSESFRTETVTLIVMNWLECWGSFIASHFSSNILMTFLRIMLKIYSYFGIINSYWNSNKSITYFHWKVISIDGIWTSDLPSTKPMRYQLNYPGLDPIALGYL